ncbi:MAG: hypothetical protein ACXABY_04020 [Candidatus Thorarchaeota archaeon]|jgi:hypothetical protein
MVQIQEGNILKGPFWPERVKVVSTKPIGEKQIRIEAVGVDSRKFYNPVLSEKDIGNIEITEEISFQFSGDGDSMFLYIESNRIRNAFQFDPLYAVNVSQIDPLPEWIKETEGEVVQLVGRTSETIQVEKVEEMCIPLGAPGGKPLRISLTSTMGGGTQLSLSERFSRQLPPPDLTFEDVWSDLLGNRIEDWLDEDSVLYCDYDDLSTSDRRNFTTNLEIASPELPGIGKFKRTVVRNVPVAPSSLEDAQRWMEWLLVETLSGYLSESGYEEHVEHIDGHFPWYSVYLPPRERMARSVLEEWRSQEKEEPLKPQYWYLRAPIDLNPGGG